MVDIEKIKSEIIENLMPLNPDKIILFGSYASGFPNDNSDIDILLLKENLERNETRKYRVDARINLYKLIKKYKIGFDILSARASDINNRQDYFYRVDILQKGKVIYERDSG